MSQQAAPKRITLPEDRKVELFMLAKASELADHRIHTADAYDKEILIQDVKSLSGETRRMDESWSRRLHSKQQKHGAIRDVPNERTLRRPPNFVIVFAILFAVLAFVTYGQSSPTISSQFWYGITYYGADIAIGTLLIVALIFYVVMRRRKK